MKHVQIQNLSVNRALPIRDRFAELIELSIEYDAEVLVISASEQLFGKPDYMKLDEYQQEILIDELRRTFVSLHMKRRYN